MLPTPTVLLVYSLWTHDLLPNSASRIRTCFHKAAASGGSANASSLPCSISCSLVVCHLASPTQADCKSSETSVAAAVDGGTATAASTAATAAAASCSATWSCRTPENRSTANSQQLCSFQARGCHAAIRALFCGAASNPVDVSRTC